MNTPSGSPSDAQRFARAEALFHEALELPATEREVFVLACCGDDSAQARMVFRLLSGDERAPADDDFLRPGGDNIPPEIEAELLRLKPEEEGDCFGPYRLLQSLGSGGYGNVWMAQQDQPIRRRVALKIIQVGRSSRAEVIGRFAQERQALALMDHPNIAKILDAGETGFGRPYFVMELIHGVHITEYCDTEKLTTADRLRLFIDVCRAVQHAHEKGVIHRDLKPGNILVTLVDGEAVPKIIDFGVAKAVQQPLTELPFFTRYEEMIGTPIYMSPEQAQMSTLDIDTRSDVYSLGVLLYELVTGRLPFDTEELLKQGFDEIRRVICEEEPKKPSTMISQMGPDALTRTASRRRTVAPKLAAIVRGDLDWIIMKALEKNRARRYATPGAMADDLERHLRHEAVEACPPSVFYQASRLARRHKFAFASAAGIALAVLGGLVVSLILLKKTRVEKAKSQAISGMLQEILRETAPARALGRDTTLLRDMLDRAADRIGTTLKMQPDAESEIRRTIGNVYFDLGEYAKAEAMHRAAWTLFEQQGGADSVAAAGLLNDLANAQRAQGTAEKLDEAEAALRCTLSIYERRSGKADGPMASALNDLAIVMEARHRWPDAEALHRQALAIRLRLLNAESPAIALSWENLANVLTHEHRAAEAETLHRDAAQIFLKSGDNLAAADSLDNLGNTLQEENKLAESETQHRHALDIFRKLLGCDNPELAIAVENLAAVLQAQRKFPEAEALHREAREIFERMPGSKPPALDVVLRNLAQLLNDEGKPKEAGEVLSEAANLFRKGSQSDGGNTGTAAPRTIATSSTSVVHPGSSPEAGPSNH